MCSMDSSVRFSRIEVVPVPRKGLDVLSHVLLTSGTRLVKIQFLKTETVRSIPIGVHSPEIRETEVLYESRMSESTLLSFSLPMDTSPSSSTTCVDSESESYEVEIAYALVATDCLSGAELHREAVSIDPRPISVGRIISIHKKYAVSVGVCCWASEEIDSVTLLVDSETDVASIGHAFTFYVEAYNYSSADIVKISAMLVQTRRLGKVQRVETVNKINFRGVQAGRYIPSFPVTFQIPIASLPSMQSKGVDCQYHVKLVLTVSGGADLEAKIPISILPATSTPARRAVSRSR